MITIKDVAKRAQVSPGTISNVLTGKRRVSELTRSRVLSAVEELGYHPNILARSLINRRSETIAVVATGLEYFGPSQTVVGIEQESHDLGYFLMLSLLYQPDSPVEMALSALLGRRVDGIIWAVPEVSDNRKWITPERLEHLPPMVFLSMAPRPGLTVVAADNRGGATQAVRHLADTGRRTIGVITGPLHWWEARERCDAWVETMRQIGLPTDDSLQVEGNWSAASGEQGLRRLLTLRPDIDAVFACNDQMALGALRAAHAAGRRVPEDLAVVGYDNIPEAAYFQPPLTTVYQGMIEVGRAAVRKLHTMIEAEHDGYAVAGPLNTLLSPELMIRESSR
ncbi:MAG: LacI family DNA-binding transcriptional regulator [Chloroflexi bacterium]|nr:LacI family DNA-binding transcriptional regulator [Chloroflexota bacterium]